MSEQTQISFTENQNQDKNTSNRAKKIAATLGATASLFAAAPAVSAEAATKPVTPHQVKLSPNHSKPNRISKIGTADMITTNPDGTHTERISVGKHTVVVKHPATAGGGRVAPAAHPMHDDIAKPDASHSEVTQYDAQGNVILGSYVDPTLLNK